MDDALHGGSRAPATLTVGGFSRRRVMLVLVILASLAFIVGAPVTWAVNYEPLTVDNGGIGIRPHDIVVRQVSATSPRGDGFTQFTIQVGQNGTFSFLFWIHNDGPFPVTVADVGYHYVGLGPRTTQVRIGPALGTERPTSTLPYTIPAHAYATVSVTDRLIGCVGSASYWLGAVPVSFRLLGFIHRRSTVYPPMTIAVESPPGTTCPS